MDFSEFEITNAELEEILNATKIFKSLNLTEIAQSHEKQILNNSLRITPILPVITQTSTFNDIYRISVNKNIKDDNQNKRLYKIQDLKYPPLHKAKKLNYNRCNYKGQSIFYGGFGKLFSLVETQPEKGDLITISKWRIKEGAELCYVPIFQDEKINEYTDVFRKEWNCYLNKLSELDSKQRTTIDQIYSLITFFFTRPVENKIEYIFSAYFANKFFSISDPYKIEAIFYPSVPNEYISCNLAILPEIFDSKFIFLEAWEQVVVTDRNKAGGWISHQIAVVKNVKENGLIWENRVSNKKLNELKQTYNFEL